MSAFSTSHRSAVGNSCMYSVNVGLRVRDDMGTRLTAACVIIEDINAWYIRSPLLRAAASDEPMEVVFRSINS